MPRKSKRQVAAALLGAAGGRVGGKSKSPAKLAACRRNAAVGREVKRLRALKDSSKYVLTVSKAVS